MQKTSRNSESDKKEETIRALISFNEVKSEDNTEAAAGITTPAEKTEAAAPAMEETVDSEDIPGRSPRRVKADTNLDTAAERSKADAGSDTFADIEYKF